MNLDELIKQGALTREPVDQNLIIKEMEEAESDLREAGRSLTQHNREEADYHYNHDKAASENALSAARDFVKRMKEMLAANK